MNIPLRQRGRASFDFLAAFGAATGRVRRDLAEELTLAGITNGTLSSDFDARCREFNAAIVHAPSYEKFASMRSWSAERHGAIAIESFEEIRALAQPMLDALSSGPTTLEPTLGDDVPDYYRDVAFHGTGSWDRHEYMGYVHGELVHRKLVARNFGGDIYGQRTSLVEELGEFEPRRILELGSSSGNFTTALARKFPDAELVGVDVSIRMLQQAQRVGNEQGRAWRLYQRAAEDTGFKAESFDLVTAYALGHEITERAMQAVLREAWRVLTPGGRLLFGDVVPFVAQDKITQCWANFEALHGGEPYWQEFSHRDMAADATAIGFESARYYGLGPRKHPFVLSAQKPRDSKSAVRGAL